MLSATVLAVSSESVGVVTSDSSTSVRVRVKVWSAVEPSACCSNCYRACLAGLAVEAGSATVTTPVDVYGERACA